MPDSSESRALLLQINATTELLRSQLSEAERATASFQSSTQKHLDTIDGRFDLLGKGIEKIQAPLERLKRLGETAFGFLVGESLIAKGREALEFAGNIQFMAEQIGVSTDFLQKFRYAASQYGSSLEVSDTALRKFTRSVGEAANGNKEQIKLFDSLGVKVLDASGKVRSVEGVFNDTSDAISKIPDPARRAADTFTLMGRGAGALIPLMASGAAGFNELASAADQLGVVLSPELIQHSEEVNHKLSALKLILDAQMASAVAQNATAIETVANAMIHAASAVAHFLSGHPETALSILGGLAGLRAGGLPGAAIGASLGYAAGLHIDEKQGDANQDLAFRQHAYAGALRQQAALIRQQQGGGGRGGIISLREETPGVRTATSVAAAARETARQFTLLQKAAHAPTAAPEAGLGSDFAGVSNPDISHHKRGPSADTLARRAEAERQRALSDDRQFQGEIRSANEAQARAKAQLADTAEGQLAVDLQALRDSEATREDQVRDQVAAGKITKARGDQLVAIYRSTEADEETLARHKEQSRVLQDQNAQGDAVLQGQIQALQIADQLATTRDERLRIELELNRLLREEAIKAQQRIIDDPTSNQSQRSIAQTTINNINASAAGQDAVTTQEHEGPLDAYRRRLHDAVNSTQDALQNVEVNALGRLEDQISGTIGKVLHLKGAFGELASSVIADLARIEIENLILGFLPGGAGGGFLASLFGGGRASGGGIDASKFYLVGENGPELFAPGVSGSIIPNGALRSPSVGALSGARQAQREVIYVQVDKSDLFDTHVRRAAAPMAQAAMIGGSNLAQQEIGDHQDRMIP